jgi:hypothetical protein
MVQNKTGTERKILPDPISMWNLKKWKSQNQRVRTMVTRGWSQHRGRDGDVVC